MISRRQLLLLSAGVLAGAAARAQERRRKAVVAILSQSSASQSKPFRDILTEEMARLGWREGVEVEYVSRFSNGSPQLDSLAAELVALKPDLILAGLPAAALAARKHTSAIPIVFRQARRQRHRHDDAAGRTLGQAPAAPARGAARRSPHRGPA
jgi:ABC-type uncharacterized transport system substrate-binding protein